MKGIKSFCHSAFFVALTLGIACLIIGGLYRFKKNYFYTETGAVEETKYGAYLAAQHALYVNDFVAADNMIKNIDSEFDVVSQDKILASFFSGNMPENIEILKNYKDPINKLIYDAYLIKNNNWSEVYKRRAKDDYTVVAPVRIFSAVKAGKTKEAQKILSSLKNITEDWKAFLSGQIAVLNNDVETAAKEFAKVSPDFMNINDYLYLMSFYQENEMFEDMDILRDDFTNGAGGMFLLNYKDVPDWSEYAGYENTLAFSMIQTVSHVQILTYSDLALLLLRFADAISDTNQDALNFYLGQYYLHNFGDWEQSFNDIDIRHPLYLFGQMNIAERKGDFYKMERLAGKNPLFIPAVDSVLMNYIKTGNKRAALNLINSALKNKDLSDSGRIYFLEHRANVHLMFNNPDAAQSDINEILDIDANRTVLLKSLQARVWYQKDINLHDAYGYSMDVVKRNISNVYAWDLVGRIVAKTEGEDAALDLLERLNEMSVPISSLYETLGDLYVKKGDYEKAKRFYLRAIDLADDGFIVVPFVQKKIRKIK